jgi:nitrite reductase (NADH) large subunit
MYYVQTADRLTRTSVWLEKMEGGIDYLREVIIDDRLGICDDLEKQMQFLVDTYQCEWKEVVNDPAKRRLFKQFVNTDDTEPTIEFVKQREQERPADWTGSFVSVGELTLRQGVRSQESGDRNQETASDSCLLTPDSWFQVGKVWDFPHDGGATIKYGKTQIAVFNFTSRGEWYATQNMCPHRREFVLSRGMIGDQNGKPKVVCPVHKKTFSLESGACLSGDELSVRVFPVKIESDDAYLQLPPVEELDAVLATEKTCNGSCHNTDATIRPKKARSHRKAKVPELLPADPNTDQF